MAKTEDKDLEAGFKFFVLPCAAIALFLIAMGLAFDMKSLLIVGIIFSLPFTVFLIFLGITMKYEQRKP